MGWLVATSAVALACAHSGAGTPPLARAPGPNAGPCRGNALDLDLAAPSCAVHEEPRPLPPTSALRLEVIPSEIEVEEGGGAWFTVQMMNVTVRAMTLDLTFGCAPFETWTYAEGSEARVDLEEEEGCKEVGVGCMTGDPVRVTLEPGGSLRKQLAFSARVERRERWRGQCTQAQGRSLPPGRYVVRVLLPLFDPVPGQPHSRKPRSVEVRVNVGKRKVYPLGENR